MSAEPVPVVRPIPRVSTFDEPNTQSLPSHPIPLQEKPLDLSQRLEHNLARYNASRNVFIRWWFEIVSVSASAICMGAIVGVLYYLHDQPLSKWPSGLTIIAVLSKLASAALILPISEAIGQLKWTWFHGKNSRDAFDFEIFDKASRGAWGSFILLYRTRGKSLAALGALLTVLLLAIDTFFQQVTDLPERWKLEGESFIPRVIRYEPKVEMLYDTSFMNNEPSTIVNTDLQTALSPFFYDKNGTFPLKIGNATQAEIPLHPILDALIVSSSDGTVGSVYAKTPPVAQECMLSWCVETLRSSYDSGDYEEQVVETSMNTTSAEWPWWTQDYPEQQMTLTEFRTNISIFPPSAKSGAIPFGVSNETFLDLVIIFDEIFPSLITVADATAPPFVKIRTAAVDNVYSRLVQFSPWLAPNNVAFHMQRMARTMTNVIRSDTNSNELVVGIAQALETYVAVHWAWLTFPLVMLCLSIIFLVATMLKTSSSNHDDVGIWKTSAMPTLMYGLPQDMQRDIIATTSSGGSSHGGSHKVRIRLLPKQGWRVSGQVQLPPKVPPGFI
ncbi:unnamed protein product [Alternaria alternata]